MRESDSSQLKLNNAVSLGPIPSVYGSDHRETLVSDATCEYTPSKFPAEVEQDGSRLYAASHVYIIQATDLFSSTPDGQLSMDSWTRLSA